MLQSRDAPVTFREYQDDAFHPNHPVFLRTHGKVSSQHNFAVFALQREFFRRSLPFLIVPVRVWDQESEVTAASIRRSG